MKKVFVFWVLMFFAAVSIARIAKADHVEKVAPGQVRVTRTESFATVTTLPELEERLVRARQSRQAVDTFYAQEVAKWDAEVARLEAQVADAKLLIQ